MGWDVDFCEPPGGQSDDGRHDQELAAFHWTTLNVKVRTLVTEFDPGAAPGLEQTGTGSSGYHRWIFTASEDGGCLVDTEEVQTGPVPRLLARQLRRQLHANHQRWLEELIRVSPGEETEPR